MKLPLVTVTQTVLQTKGRKTKYWGYMMPALKFQLKVILVNWCLQRDKIWKKGSQTSSTEKWLKELKVSKELLVHLLNSSWASRWSSRWLYIPTISFLSIRDTSLLPEHAKKWLRPSILKLLRPMKWCTSSTAMKPKAQQMQTHRTGISFQMQKRLAKKKDTNWWMILIVSHQYVTRLTAISW